MEHRCVSRGLAGDELRVKTQPGLGRTDNDGHRLRLFIVDEPPPPLLVVVVVTRAGAGSSSSLGPVPAHRRHHQGGADLRGWRR
uniref:Uncharacterized protein n=1 Tax=Oryza sativa subsp. japonica TaxID=39947 RepID=Q6ZB92_ORYSJ|nr:hypothetical protein [Oryza sativa Japonica Group]